MQEQGQGSAPTSPYGHPKGLAVAHGIGMGRHAHQGQQLPSISDWQGEYAGQINPMFRVVSGRFPLNIHRDSLEGKLTSRQQPPSQGLEPGQGQKTTLPPFSAIASVADAQAQRHNQGK
jgi:meiosis induction protein kinase IME2/SME1